MMSDVCKHCVRAGCLEVCPTGAIVRTEFDSVYIQQDVCNGCRACLSACPFGVVDIGADGKAHKCTLCYDRLQHGMEPACAQACPTDSIRFGEVSEMLKLAEERVAELQAQGIPAYIYGKEDIVGGLNCFYLLVDRPEVYGLPARPELPSKNVPTAFGFTGLTAVALAATAVVSFRKRRMEEGGGDGGDDGTDRRTTPPGVAPPSVGIDAVLGTQRLHREMVAQEAPPPRRSLPILGQAAAR
jgi:formate dehydrogenase iron-sulfur subunit